VPPTADWLPGESQTFYVYHQMATGELFNIKCDAPHLQATGLPITSCLQVGGRALGALGRKQGGPLQLPLLSYLLTGQLSLCLLP
jgi:hypothetical protein